MRVVGRHLLRLGPEDRAEPARRRRYEIVTFCALLLFQYPFVFALERGNTDTVNVLFYTLAAFLFVRRPDWLAGMAAGVAAGFKLSPIVAIVVMTGALFSGGARVGALDLGPFARRRADGLRADAAGVLQRREDVPA